MTGMIAVSVVMFLSAGCTGKTGSGHPGEQDKVQVPGVGLCVHDAATLHLDGRHLCGFALRCGERGAAQNRRTDNCGIRKVGRYPAVRHGESGRVAGHADGNLYPKIVNDTQIDMIMLRHFLNDFLSFVPLQLPQLLDVTTMEEPQFYGDYVLLTFPLRDTYELEEVMDMFEDDMELITLYHHIPMRTEPYGHSTCAYSNPAFGQMFKMNAKTDADGRVSCILATIYDSLELMYGDLCIDLDLHSKSGIMKYKRNKDDVLMDFI